MITYLTTGQVAKKLRISVSTLKRWLDEAGPDISDQRNYNGWRLFSEDDLKVLMEYKRNLKRNGKRFNETTLLPVILSGTKNVRNG
jgi:DNA-binding transcriptional MerR regulator